MKKHTTSKPHVYLIHFTRKLGNPDSPRGQAGHYLGSADDLAARLERHRQGNGSAIMAAVARQGISWVLARTWEGGRDLEYTLKGRKNAPRLCPICRGEVAAPIMQQCRRQPMSARAINFYRRPL